MKMKILTIAFVFILILSGVIVLFVGDVKRENKNFEYDGYNIIRQIYDWYDLDKVNDNLEADYILMNDLDEDTPGYEKYVDTGEGWEPIGEWGDRFTGSLDGNGHEVRGLYIHQPNEGYMGLFGCFDDGAEIYNLSLVDVHITGGRRVGGIVGSNPGHETLVENSSVTGEIDGYQFVGGLIGWNRGVVSNSYSAVNVSGHDKIGGITGASSNTVIDSKGSGNIDGTIYVGMLVGENRGMVDNSYAEGNLSGEKYLGGLVGSNLSRGTVKDSYASVNVTGGEHVGGVTGRNYHSTVSNSYATGDVSGETNVGGLVGLNNAINKKTLIESSSAFGDISGGEFIGGLVGKNRGLFEDALINNSYSAGNVHGDEFVGGFVGENYRSIILDSYSTGDVKGEKHVGGLLGNNHGTVSNTHYNIDKVLINGGHHVTIGGLFNNQYQDWIEDKNLDIEDYSDNLEFSEEYYEISGTRGLKDLLGFADYEGYKFRLTGDVNLSAEPGLYIPYFEGTLDGGGNTISNLHIDMHFASNIGMIGHLNNGEVANIGVRNVYLNGTASIGGLVGRNAEGTISESYSIGKISGYKETGGLIGYNDGEVSDVYTAGYVSGGFEIGGLIGINYGIMTNSYTTKNVSANRVVGMLIGSNNGEVSNSFFEINSSRWYTTNVGAGKISEEMKDVATFTDENTEGLEESWDFSANPYDDGKDENIWDIDIYGRINEGYPFLSWEEEREHKLDIDIEGRGSVKINGTEVRCGWAGTFKEGDILEITYEVSENWYFDRWTGDISGADSEISVTMEEDMTVTPEFKHYVTIEIQNVEGNGTVFIDGEEVTATPFEKYYEQGEEADISAYPDQGWYFDEWEGIDQKEADTTIIINENVSISNVLFEEYEKQHEEREGSFGPVIGVFGILMILLTLIGYTLKNARKESNSNMEEYKKDSIPNHEND